MQQLFPSSRVTRKGNFPFANPLKIMLSLRQSRFSSPLNLTWHRFAALGNTISYGPSLPESYILENGYSTGAHERQHTYQGEVLGPLYLPAAGVSLIMGTVFDGNPHGSTSFMEVGPQMSPPRPFPSWEAK